MINIDAKKLKSCLDVLGTPSSLGGVFSSLFIEEKDGSVLFSKYDEKFIAHSKVNEVSDQTKANCSVNHIDFLKKVKSLTGQISISVGNSKVALSSGVNFNFDSMGIEQPKVNSQKNKVFEIQKYLLERMIADASIFADSNPPYDKIALLLQDNKFFVSSTDMFNCAIAHTYIEIPTPSSGIPVKIQSIGISNDILKAVKSFEDTVSISLSKEYIWFESKNVEFGFRVDTYPNTYKFLPRASEIKLDEKSAIGISEPILKSSKYVKLFPDGRLCSLDGQSEVKITTKVNGDKEIIIPSAQLMDVIKRLKLSSLESLTIIDHMGIQVLIIKTDLTVFYISGCKEE